MRGTGARFRVEPTLGPRYSLPTVVTAGFIWVIRQAPACPRRLEDSADRPSVTRGLLARLDFKHDFA